MSETQDYLEIMAGRKRLELEYKEGNLVSGYTAHGLSARIIENLHCGQYIDGWGFLVDREFEDGDIDKMKRHFYEWKEMERVQRQIEEKEHRLEEEERNQLLSEVTWTKEKCLQLYGGISYRHLITIDSQQYCFEEKKISGLGRVIVPEYEVSESILGEPVAKLIDGKWHWSVIHCFKEEMIPMTAREERAYLIVYRYGSLL